MSITIALAGNPNSGKTTLFNAMTGMNQFVGNWPGVTVEKKEGALKGRNDVVVVDLPGIYSMSPYTPEEMVARDFLVQERPDVIIDIVDGTNIERNLYLTTQLTEIGIPVVVAVNMMDAVDKRGDEINAENMSKALGCKVVKISALKGEGLVELAKTAVEIASFGKTSPQHIFRGTVEHALAHIEEAVLHDLPDERQRWYAIKLFERDGKVAAKLGVDGARLAHIEQDIRACEAEMDDDSESIITCERYSYIESVISRCRVLKHANEMSLSDKIDLVVTNRVLALPIFVAIMFVVYYVSITSVGALATDWANDGVFGEGWNLFGAESLPVPGVPELAERFLNFMDCAPWLRSLVTDGIIAGVGAVLGFVPQMFILFFFLAFLEACGYMARAAFIMDRIFRRFGLSGRSFIPLLISSGCGVPGIMASRTIKSDRDRKITVMTTTFIPCSAKLPIIALIAGAIFGGAWWVAPSAYFVGIAAVVCSGVILKKTRLFAGDVSPFVMELPAYHWPVPRNIALSVWERGWSFIKRAGTIIMLASIFVWFTSNYGWSDGSFGQVDMSESILAVLGSSVAWIFAPLGWGSWQAAVTTLTGLIAKENLVGTMGVLFGVADEENSAAMWSVFAAHFPALSAYSFLLFNMLCAPCFAAMGAIRREMMTAKWFWIAVLYQCGFAYAVSLCFYRIGMFISSGVFGIWTIVAAALLVMFLWLLFRSDSGGSKKTGWNASAASPING
ncbi:ferrous iron transporter B [Synergistales bacterium]|nr:ferrous iron transporter B [Synergistales bacterium]